MWEALGSTLKIFVEKHLIPTIIAFVGGAGLLIFLPSNHWLLTKAGETVFFVFAAGSIFLFVQAIIALQKRIVFLRKRKQEHEQEQKEKEKEAKEELEEVYSFVESLYPDDRQKILQFIRSDNAQIVEYSCPYYSSSELYRSDYIIHMNCGNGFYAIKLEDKFYQTIKKLYDSTGNITRFSVQEVTDEELPF